jgi:hypothetical protein
MMTAAAIGAVKAGHQKYQIDSDRRGWRITREDGVLIAEGITGVGEVCQRLIGLAADDPELKQTEGAGHD